jgi:NAD(P)-dependent dehydrogenase (short-subunit alcohol dehydrogenase family)
MMKNKTILITGATSGIGKLTALELARAGAHIFVTGRSQTSGVAAVAELQQKSGNQNINLLLGDLSSQADVRSLAAAMAQKVDHLDVLINNAGLAEAQRRITADGVEADFAVNVIAPFLLTQLLMPLLKASPSARVITLTGGDRHPARIEMDNLQAERSFVGLTTYTHAKLVMMAVMFEYAQRLQGTHVNLNVCFPGQARTNMTRGVTPKMLPGLLRLMYPIFKLMTTPDNDKSAALAARTSIYLASSSTVEGVNGKYFDTNSKIIAWPAPVHDQAIRAKLWTLVEQLSHV